MSLARTPLKARTHNEDGSRRYSTFTAPRKPMARKRMKQGRPKKRRRHDPLGRFLATKPCLSCGVVGFSQGAHLGLSRNEKGTGMTVNDQQRAPLCCSRPGIDGCHVEYDRRKGKFLGWSDAERWEAARSWLALVELMITPDDLAAAVRLQDAGLGHIEADGFGGWAWVPAAALVGLTTVEATG